MCRLFGFRSILDSQVHHSLIDADNSVGLQKDHPDGWGVSYYIAGAPHVVKAVRSAHQCNLFKKVSGLVSSQTVIAHVRKATLGETSIINTHPFQHGHWTFAHNGNIKDFDKHKDAILKEIPKELRKFILGTTDSEVFFYFILSKLQKEIDIYSFNNSAKKLSNCIFSAIKSLTNIIGPFSLIDDAGPTETYLSFILTNGKSMLAFHGGKDIYYSTHKTKCSERDTCPSFSEVCENATDNGKINHLLFSSEPLSGENIWLPMKNAQLIGVDDQMNLHIEQA